MGNQKKSGKNADESLGASGRINRELYKRNAELAVRNKTLALLRSLDEISLRAIGVQTTAEQIAQAIATEFGYELVSVVTSVPEEQELRWLAFASSVSQYRAIVDHLVPSEPSPSRPAPSRESSGSKSRPVLVRGTDDFFPTGIQEKLSAVESDPIVSTLIHPLSFEKRILGYISFSSARNLEELTKYEHEAIEGIVSLVSLALYKATLFEDLETTTRQLRDANKRLKELMAIKTEFLHIASHQLRTPLTSLRGFLDMQASGDFDQLTPERRKELQKTMALSANQLNDLVNDLLNAMELEGGTPNLKLQPTDLWQVIQEAVSTQQLAFDKKKLKLNATKPVDRLPMISADPTYLRQVFLNALDNAMKYTEKGSVTITAKPVGKNIEINIVDTGIGIDPRDMPKLFGKFVRGGQTEKMQTTGSGLGLFIMKKITEQHHGTIKLLSDGIGKGTTVRVTLPMLPS